MCVYFSQHQFGSENGRENGLNVLMIMTPFFNAPALQDHRVYERRRIPDQMTHRALLSIWPLFFFATFSPKNSAFMGEIG